ncbi:MAG: hypothetical protein J0M02_14140 [Planctomycetes bacterium]|nr:hypothetical protein [Planctomycetota bacterium]
MVRMTVDTQPDLAEARLLGLMLCRHDDAWQVELDLLHHGTALAVRFDGIAHVLLAGIPAATADHVACAQVRSVPPAMRGDLGIGDDHVAVRFEFTSGTSLLVVCADFTCAPAT